MSKIPRTKAKKPPLSKLDCFLYGSAIVAGIALTITCIVVFMFVIPEMIAKSRFGVVAVMPRVASVLFPMPFWMAVLMVTVIPASYGLKAKQPLFGNKSFKPRWGDTVINVFPLFSKDFREKIYPRYRRKVRKYVRLSGIGLLISAAILPLGVCQVKTLSADGSLKTSNAFGLVSHESSVYKAEKMEISIGTHSGKNGTSRFPRIVYMCGKTEYELRTGYFCDTTRSEALSYMIDLKERRNGRYEVKDRDRIRNLSDYEGYTPYEMALVKELFE